MSRTSLKQEVSNFIVNTCRVNPQPNRQRFNSFYQSITILLEPVDDCCRFVMSSGSASEFYIEPMLPCINDCDIMHYRNDSIALPAGHPIPPRLPAEYHRRVEVFEILETACPCYVLLRLAGEVVKCNNSNCYEYVPNTGGYLSHVVPLDDPSRHGPAVMKLDLRPINPSYITGDRRSSRLSVDMVHSIRCIVWPPQAAEWVTRRREYGWPDLSTVDRIVNDGCNLVQTVHPQFRQDEWVRKTQWRLSFSGAETVLLNSWSLHQQIVYHILRFFMKTVQADYGVSNSIHNYFIKTVMLYSSELNSPTDWISNDLIYICNWLIHSLVSFVTVTSPSYFVKHCDLRDALEFTQELENLTLELKNLTEDSLCSWLIENYIPRCVEQCPSHISAVFPSDGNLRTLTLALSIITDWRRGCFDEIALCDSDEACFRLQVLAFSHYPLQKYIMFKYIIGQLYVADSRLVTYFHAVCCLKVAWLIECGRSAVLLSDAILWLVQSDEFLLSPEDSSINSVSDHGNKMVFFATTGAQSFRICHYFLTASVLLRSVRVLNNKDTSNFRLLVEIAKIYLHSALECTMAECTDFHGMSRGLLNVYLACLYSSTKQYKIASHRSRIAITFSNDFEDVHCHIERQLLPCFDVSLETTLGSIALYHFLQQKLGVHKHIDQHAFDICTADLLAYYIANLQSQVRCSQPLSRSWDETYDNYRYSLLNNRHLTIADVLLFHEVQRRANIVGQRKRRSNCVSRSSSKRLRHTVGVQSGEFNTTRLCQLLMQFASEHLTAFRVVMSRDFRSTCPIVMSDFQAMYAYKRCLFEQCASLCESDLARLIREDNGIFTRVFLVRKTPLFYLVDDDCMSLIGLATLCGIFNDELVAVEIEAVVQLTLSLYLLIQSKLQLRHPAATFVKSLCTVINLYAKHSTQNIINRAMLMFVYFKAFRRLRSSNVYNVPLQLKHPHIT
jgi:Mab-21 protein